MSTKVIAHRGNPVRYPENTLSSFRSALSLDVTDLELDAQLSKDGVPVVFHDYTVDRMTDGTGNIGDYPLAELKRLQVEGKEEIPTLEEALRLLKGQVQIHLELKKQGVMYPELETRVLHFIRKLDMADQVIITSFDHDSLVRVRRLDREIPIGLIAGNSSPAFLPFIKELGACSLEMRHTCITEPYIQWCEPNGVQLAAWTVNDREEMEKFHHQYPSVLVCTDRVEDWIVLAREHL